ncbi:phage protein [Escherichia coli KTE38]|uniref:DUF1482 family protein n=1 Tax=Escherichia coli TaxID=562 RepID=UPI00033C9B30|nr:DUF1482 family protein [Escherichia coli]EOV07001.1 phage protein [Escherichia coli KTE38]EOV09279.1 phage protein [Escherichia coli KTE38]
MTSAFVLVLTVFLVSGESVDVVVGVYGSMESCLPAGAEQKISGDCFPVDKVFL